MVSETITFWMLDPLKGTWRRMQKEFGESELWLLCRVWIRSRSRSACVLVHKHTSVFGCTKKLRGRVVEEDCGRVPVIHWQQGYINLIDMHARFDFASPVQVLARAVSQYWTNIFEVSVSYVYEWNVSRYRILSAYVCFVVPSVVCWLSLVRVRVVSDWSRAQAINTDLRLRIYVDSMAVAFHNLLTFAGIELSTFASTFVHRPINQTNCVPKSMFETKFNKFPILFARCHLFRPSQTELWREYKSHFIQTELKHLHWQQNIKTICVSNLSKKVTCLH